MKTTGNSSPFAACTVINWTASWPAWAWLSPASSEACDKKPASGDMLTVSPVAKGSSFEAVAGCTMARLAGKPVFIGGCRRGKQQLFYVHAERNNPLALKAELIEEGVGPSNVHVVHEANRDIIVAANREKAEAALYFVS